MTKLQPVLAPGDTTKFLRLLQEADERLLEFGRWNWTRAKITLTPVDGLVSLPVEYESILAARLGSYAKSVHAEEFEFTPDGPGEVTITGAGDGRLIDQGMVEDTYDGTVETRRVYKISGGVPDNDDVVALVRYAPLDLTDCADTDYVRCPDLAALKLAMLAIIMEEATDLVRSKDYMATALRGLDNKEKAHRAGARQSLQVRPFGAGITGIRSQR